MEAIAEHFVNEDRCEGFYPADCRNDKAEAGIENERDHRRVNLLGVTPLDFGPLDHAETMKHSLEQYGWRINSMWAMGDSLDQLSKSADAAVNVVVSSVGLRAAKVVAEEIRYTLCGRCTGWVFYGEIVRSNGSGRQQCKGLCSVRDRKKCADETFVRNRSSTGACGQCCLCSLQKGVRESSRCQ